MVNLSSPRDIVKHAIRNDPSFKAILYPHQCFIGNIGIHLAKNVPVEVSVLKNKLYTKFAIIPQSGIGQKDTIVGFSQFKSISLKSEGSESEATRPAIIFRLTTAASQAFMRAVGENVAHALNERAMNSSSREYLESTIILILQDNPKFESEEVFMQCIVKGFGGQENQRVLNFDQKTGYDIWQNDIKMKWRVTMSEKWKKNFGNREHELVDTMAAKEFAQLMNTLQLNLKIIDNDRKYLWMRQKKIHISSLFKEKSESQPSTETLIERVGTKRKAEATPVKHGPLCTIHLFNHNQTYNDPPSLYSILCPDDRHVYVQYLVNREDADELCDCKRKYEKWTNSSKKPAYDQSDGLEETENEVSHQDCEVMKVTEDYEKIQAEEDQNPIPQAANLRISTEFEPIEMETIEISTENQPIYYDQPLPEAQNVNSPVEISIMGENQMSNDEKRENLDERAGNSFENENDEIIPKKSENLSDNTEKSENHQNFDRNVDLMLKTIDISQNLMEVSPKNVEEEEVENVVEVETCHEKMAEGDQPEYYIGRTEDIPLPPSEYQPGPSGTYALIDGQFASFNGPIPGYANVAPENPYAQLRYENSDEAIKSYAEEPLTPASGQQWCEESGRAERPMQMFDYTQGDNQEAIQRPINVPLSPLSHEQWLGDRQASSAASAIPLPPMRNPYEAEEFAVAPSLPPQSSIGNALFAACDIDDYGVYAEYFTIPPPPPPPPPTVVQLFEEPIEPVVINTQHPIQNGAIQPANDTFDTLFSITPQSASPVPLEEVFQRISAFLSRLTACVLCVDCLFEICPKNSEFIIFPFIKIHIFVDFQPALTALKSLKLVSGQRIVTKKIVRKVTNEAVHLSDDEGETSGVVVKPKGEEPEKKHLEVNEETPILTSSHSNFGSVVIIVKDMHTLARQEFVNDNIINFTIDYMYDCRIIKSLRDKVHVFVTFFYSRLSGGINSALLSNTSGLTQDDKEKLDKNINLVSRWTLKKFDLFTKEYVVIPINEEYHWLVAIVVNPSGAIVEKNNEEESRKKPKCYIVFLDPLTGLDPRRQTNMTTLIKYYFNGLFNKSKTPGTKFATPTETLWDESRIEVFRPKNQPVQANYYDCGLFVLYYIEAFFCGIKPITVHDMPGFDWLDHFEKGEDIADLMRDKVYNTITRQLTSDNRSRLEQHENRKKHGLSTEGARRHRRHSAPWPRALPRASEYHVRHYSLSPPPKNMQDQRIFNNPRELSKMIITQRVRSLRLPEEKFASMY